MHTCSTMVLLPLDHCGAGAGSLPGMAVNVCPKGSALSTAPNLLGPAQDKGEAGQQSLSDMVTKL